MKRQCGVDARVLQSQTIEWLRFSCAVLIVILHSMGRPLDGNDVISYQYGAYDTIRILFSECLCRVAVPIFFLISGYLFFIRLEQWNTSVWLLKLRKRVQTLLVPYVLWNLYAIGFSLLMLYPYYWLKGGDVPTLSIWFDEIGGINAFWIRPLNAPLWFMRDLMLFVLIAPLVYLFVKKLQIVGLALIFVAYAILGGGKYTGIFT